MKNHRTGAWLLLALTLGAGPGFAEFESEKIHEGKSTRQVAQGGPATYRLATDGSIEVYDGRERWIPLRGPGDTDRIVASGDHIYAIGSQGSIRHVQLLELRELLHKDEPWELSFTPGEWKALDRGEWEGGRSQDILQIAADSEFLYILTRTRDIHAFSLGAIAGSRTRINVDSETVWLAPDRSERGLYTLRADGSFGLHWNERSFFTGKPKWAYYAGPPIHGAIQLQVVQGGSSVLDRDGTVWNCFGSECAWKPNTSAGEGLQEIQSLGTYGALLGRNDKGSIMVVGDISGLDNVGRIEGSQKTKQFDGDDGRVVMLKADGTVFLSHLHEHPTRTRARREWRRSRTRLIPSDSDPRR